MSAQSGPRCKYCGQPNNDAEATIVCEKCKKDFRSDAINKARGLARELAEIFEEFQLTAAEVKVTK